MALSKDAPWYALGFGVLVMALFFGMAFLVVGAAFGGIGEGPDDSGPVGNSDYDCNVGSADEVEQQVRKELGSDVADPANPPKVLIPVYQAAAAEYGLGPKGPNILASINRIETAFGTNRNVSSAGAQGWMQFMPATWTTQGVDADGNGKKDIQDPDDAIFAAANYLKNSGAPGNWQSAIFAYNHAQWYVDDVVSHAEKYNIPEGESARCVKK